MNEASTRTTKKPQGVLIAGIVLLVIGGGLGVWSYMRAAEWVGATEDYARFEAPGRMTVQLNEAGDYSVYAESRSVIDGTARSSTLSPSHLDVTIEDASGSALPFQQTDGSATFTYDAGAYSGELIGTFHVDAPQDVTVRATTAGGGADGTLVIALGESITTVMGGAAFVFFGFCGGGVVILAGLVLGIVGGVQLMQRRRAA